jgi:hypothetical protein
LQKAHKVGYNSSTFKVKLQGGVETPLPEKTKQHVTPKISKNEVFS